MRCSFSARITPTRCVYRSLQFRPHISSRQQCIDRVLTDLFRPRHRRDRLADALCSCHIVPLDACVCFVWAFSNGVLWSGRSSANQLLIRSGLAFVPDRKESKEVFDIRDVLLAMRELWVSYLTSP